MLWPTSEVAALSQRDAEVRVLAAKAVRQESRERLDISWQGTRLRGNCSDVINRLCRGYIKSAPGRNHQS